MLSKEISRGSEGVYIMKFFCSLGMDMKFVLYDAGSKAAKQSVLYNPGKPTQPTLLHSYTKGDGLMGFAKDLFNHLTMYICSLLKFTKRSWEFFAMGEKGEIASSLVLHRNDRINLHKPTRIYTNLHALVNGEW